jgi:hypothetical protein
MGSPPSQSPGFVNTTYFDGGDLFFGTSQGYFTGAAWQYAIKWNGTQWSGLGGNSVLSMNWTNFQYGIYSIIRYNGAIYIAGDFMGGMGAVVFNNLCKLQ